MVLSRQNYVFNATNIEDKKKSLMLDGRHSSLRNTLK